MVAAAGGIGRRLRGGGHHGRRRRRRGRCDPPRAPRPRRRPARPDRRRRRRGRLLSPDARGRDGPQARLRARADPGGRARDGRAGVGRGVALDRCGTGHAAGMRRSRGARLRSPASFCGSGRDSRERGVRGRGRRRRGRVGRAADAAAVGVPADSPLGRRTTIDRQAAAVAAVLPDAGLGHFSLRPTQVTGRSSWCRWPTRRRSCGEGDVANALFAIAGADPAVIGRPARRRCVRGSTTTASPSRPPPLPSADPTAGGPLRLTSRRLIPPAIDRAAARGARAARRPSRRSCFSPTTSCRLTGPARPAAARSPTRPCSGSTRRRSPAARSSASDGEPLAMPAADEIIIDRWMADDLAAQGRPVAVGDRLGDRASSCRRRSTAGSRRRRPWLARSPASPRCAGRRGRARPRARGGGRERRRVDRRLGSALSLRRRRGCARRRRTTRTTATGRSIGTTPKAFVSLATARRLAGSRFGRTTAWHVPLRPRRPMPQAIGRAARRGIRAERGRHPGAAARGPKPRGRRAGLDAVRRPVSRPLVVRRRGRAAARVAAVPPARRGAAARCRHPAPRSAGRRARLAAACSSRSAASPRSSALSVGALLGPLWAQAPARRARPAWNTAVAAGSAAVFGAAPVAIVPSGRGACRRRRAGARGSRGGAARRAGRQPPLALLARRARARRRHRSPRAGRRWLVVAAIGAGRRRAAASGRRASRRRAGRGAVLSRRRAPRSPGCSRRSRSWLAAPASLRILLGVARPARLAVRWPHRPARAFSVAAIVAFGRVSRRGRVGVCASARRSPGRSAVRPPAAGRRSPRSASRPAIDPADPARAERSASRQQQRRWRTARSRGCGRAAATTPAARTSTPQGRPACSASGRRSSPAAAFVRAHHAPARAAGERIRGRCSSGPTAGGTADSRDPRSGHGAVGAEARWRGQPSSRSPDDDGDAGGVSRSSACSSRASCRAP